MLKERFENLNYLLLVGYIVNVIGRRGEIPTLEYVSAGIAALVLLVIILSFKRVRKVWDKRERTHLYWRIFLETLFCITLLLLVFVK